MRRIVIVVCAALLFVPLFIKSRPSQNVSARPAFDVLSSGRMLIKVSGNVRQPGVYEVAANTLAVAVIKMAIPIKPLGHDAVQAVGTPPLSNGSAVSYTAGDDGVPRITVDSMTVKERMVLGIPLDIGKMSEADFCLLPGIGPSLARRIVMKRQENGGKLHLYDLATIEGIGEKKLEAIRKLVQHTEINN